MADPLSIAASVGGLALLARDIVKQVASVISTVRGATSQLQELRHSVALLYGYLESLDLMLDDEDDSPAPMSIIACSQTLAKIQDILKKSRAEQESPASTPAPTASKLSAKPGVWQGVKQKVRWVIDKDEVEKLLADIERHKSVLSLALSKKCLSSIIEVLRKQDETLQHMQEIKKEQNKIRQQKRQDAERRLSRERRQMLHAVSYMRPEDSFKKHFSLHQDGTGVWFLESPEFEKFMGTPNSKLWLYGIPGAGKSVLSATIIDHISTQHTEHAALAFFFCEYFNAATQTCRSIFGSIVRQLALQNPGALEILEEFFNDQTDLGQLDFNAEDGELLNLIVQMSTRFDSTIIVIDGLDQCQENRAAVVESLVQLSRDGIGSVKTLFTSRNELDIKESLTSFDSLAITASKADVSLYVAAQLKSRFRRMCEKDPALSEQILTVLVDKSEGMFQWVRCQIDCLEKLATNRQRRKALEDLPRDIHGTYEQILLKAINSCEHATIEFVERTLRWIALAMRPLSIVEIAHAISVEVDERSFDDSLDMHRILALCSSLVQEVDGHLAFSHSSVKEYLMQIRPEQGEIARFRVSDSDHSLLTQTCLVYLLLDDFDRQGCIVPADLRPVDNKNYEYGWILNPYPQYPFYHYAASRWVDHAKCCREDETVSMLKRTLFSPAKTDQFLFWAHLLLADMLFEDIFDMELSQNMYDITPLHLACIFLFTDVVDMLLRNGAKANAISAVLGSPLQCAISGWDHSSYWHPDDDARYQTVCMLLGEKVSKDQTRYDPVADALSKGDQKVAHTLLKHGFTFTISAVAQLNPKVAPDFLLSANLVDLSLGRIFGFQRAKNVTKHVPEAYEKEKTVERLPATVAFHQEERYISSLATELLQNTQLKKCDGNKLRSILIVIPILLEAFALKLGVDVGNPIHKKLMVFVHKHRNQVVAIMERMLFGLGEDILAPSSPRPSQAAGNEGVQNLIHATEEYVLPYTVHAAPQEVMVEEEKGEIERHVDDPSDYDTYRNCILQSPAYHWLLSRLQREMTLDYGEHDSMADIRKVIMSSLPKVSKVSTDEPVETVETVFVIDWDPAAFFQTEDFQGSQGVKVEASNGVETAVALTGSALNAQAVTCAEYLDQTWPFVGGHMVQLLKKIVLDYSHEPQKGELFDGTSFIAWRKTEQQLDDTKLILEVCGLHDSIVEIAEQLAWLGAAFQEFSSEASVLAVVKPVVALSSGATDLEFKNVGAASPIFSIKFIPEFFTATDASTQINGTCWHSLFRNPVIAKGFPIPSRKYNEVGLEMSLEVMALLAETPFATYYNNVLVLKGFSTMFFPTLKVAQSVIWHFLHQKDGSYLPYHKFQQNGVEYIGIEDVDLKFLEATHTRHFLGWTSSVARNLGTDDAGLYKCLDWAGVKKCMSGCALEKVSISASKIISISATISKQTKHIPEFIQSPIYPLHIAEARKWSVLIYDTNSSRGWLVDGASALLHIVRAQLTRTPISKCSFFKISDFHHPKASDGEDAAVNCLLDERNLPLSLLREDESFVEGQNKTDSQAVPETKRVWTFKDAVSQALNTLHQIHDRQEQVSSDLVSLSFQTNMLEGFEFMDIVDSASTIKPRAQNLSKGKAWLGFAKKIKAITLFGKGLGDLLTSHENPVSLCCKTVPIGQEYLTVPISVLRAIREHCRREGEVDGESSKIAQGYCWSASEDAFADCISSCRRSGGKWLQSFERSVSSTHPENALGSQSLEKNRQGAVVFGKPNQPVTVSSNNPVGSSIPAHTSSNPSTVDPSATLASPEPSSSTNSGKGNPESRLTLAARKIKKVLHWRQTKQRGA